MKIKRIVPCFASLAAFLVLAAQVTLADDDSRLKDAGFEQQLAADDGGWILFEVSLFSKNYARTGNQSMFNGGFSRPAGLHPHLSGNDSGAYQQVPASAGSRWRLTGYALTPTTLEGTPAFGIVQLSFFDADGKELGTVETVDSTIPAKTSDEINSASAAGEWIFLDTGIATAPAGTASVQAFTIFVDYSGSDKTQGVYFDDLSLCALDEDDTGRCDPE